LDSHVRYFYPNMQAIITVFKTEFEGKEYIASRLKDMVEEVKLMSGAYIFSPSPGRLFELLDVLKENKINYGTHFDSAPGTASAYGSDGQVFN
jgi:hypothetical protein